MPTPPEIRLRGPLQSEGKKQRRNLLAASVISVVIIDLGLVPNQISALGIEFSKTDKLTILSLLFIANIYFLVAFLIYALADFLSWRAELRWCQRELADKIIEGTGEKRRFALDYYEVAWGKRQEPTRIILLADIKAWFDLAAPLPLVLYVCARLAGVQLSFLELCVAGSVFLSGVIGYFLSRYYRLRRRGKRAEQFDQQS